MSRRRRCTAGIAAALGGLALGGMALGGMALVGLTRRRTPGGDPLPGDEFVPDADIVSTRSVDIRATPAQVWPWLAQMGQDKAGFYTFTALERLAGIGMPEVHALVPQWQHLAAGDRVHLAEDLFLVAARVEPPHLLVLHGDLTDAPGAKGPGFDFCWIFHLAATIDGHADGSRLTIRERYTWTGTRGRAAATAGAVMSTVMSAKMLMTIRNLAQRPQP